MAMLSAFMAVLSAFMAVLSAFMAAVLLSTATPRVFIAVLLPFIAATPLFVAVWLPLMKTEPEVSSGMVLCDVHVWFYGMRGTDLAYGAMRCAVLG
eukprot:816415-Rhodomonas_salina.1